MLAQRDDDPPDFTVLAAVLVAAVPGIALAHGGEGAIFFAGEVLSIGLVGLACLLVRTPLITRVTAFVVGVLACMVAYGIALKTIPVRLGVLGSLLLGVVPPLASSTVVFVWGTRQSRR